MLVPFNHSAPIWFCVRLKQRLISQVFRVPLCPAQNFISCCTQVHAVLEALVMLAAMFQGREEWKLCAQWCERAITCSKVLPPSAPPGGEEVPGAPKACSAPALVSSLLTLRGKWVVASWVCELDLSRTLLEMWLLSARKRQPINIGQFRISRRLFLPKRRTA